MRLTCCFAVLVLGCQPPVSSQGDGGGDLLPAFTLTDINLGSPTTGRDISLTTLRGKVSGWYFTHTT